MRASAARNLLIGLMAPLRGVRIIAASPRLRRLAILPAAVMLIFLIAGLALGVPILMDWIPTSVSRLIVALGPSVHSWLFSALYWLTLIVLWPVAVVACISLSYILHKIFVAPVYAFLAEVFLLECGALRDEPFRLGSWFAVNARMLWISIVKALVFALIGAMLFALSLLPGLALLTGFAFLLLVSFDFADYSYEALRMSFSERHRFFVAHFSSFLGFACTMGLVFFVPGLNVLIVPAAVVGAGDMVRRLKAQGFDSGKDASKDASVF